MIDTTRYENEEKWEKERKKDFILIKKYKNFSLYQHKKAGYKECFKN